MDIDELLGKYPNCNYIKLYLNAKQNFMSKDLEISMMISCIIIEAIANQKYKTKDVNPFDWLIKQDFNLDDFKNLSNLKNKYYLQNMSCSEKFTKIVVDTYTQLQEYPEFLYIKNIQNKKNGLTVIHTPHYPSSKDELEQKLNTEMKFIYGEYRSKFCHMAVDLPKITKLRTKQFFGISRPGAVTIQTLLSITLDVIEYYQNYIKK